MVDYKKIIDKIKGLNTIQEVKSVKDDNKKDVFTSSDKFVFINTLLDKDVSEKLENIKRVAILLLKVRKANGLRKLDNDLLKELEKEQKDETIAYQVVNYLDEKIDKAIDKIQLLSDSSIVPEGGKTKIEEKITQVEVEIKKLGTQLAQKNEQRRVWLKKVDKDNQKVKIAESNLMKKSNLLSILKAITVSSNSEAGTYEVILADGSKHTLGSLPNVSVSDFAGDNLFEEKKGNTIPEVSGTPLELLRSTTQTSVRGLLNSINIKSTIPHTFYETSVDETHNSRRFSSKYFLVLPVKKISGNVYSFGVSFLSILREIGTTKLEKVIDKAVSSTTERDKLKKYVNELTEIITPHEAKFGKKYVLGETETLKEFMVGFDKWQKTLLNKSIDEFPYSPKPDWKKLFELMDKVFPATWQTDEYKVDDKDYYSDDELKPADSSGEWTTKVGLSGYCKNPIGIVPLAERSYLGGVAKWINKSTTNEPDLKKQVAEKFHTIKGNTDFKSLVKLWWDSFGSLIDRNTYNWNTTGAGADVTGSEANLLNLQAEIRFTKFLRELLLKLNLISQIDELDEYLLEIANRKEKGVWIRPNVIVGNDKVNVKAVQLWNSDFSKIGDPTELLKEIGKEEINVSYLKTANDISKKAMKGLFSEISSIQTEIIKYEIELSILKNALLEDELPPEDKKKIFNDLYDKKTEQNNQWTVRQLYELVSKAKLLKGLIPGDEYDSEIKPKLDEVEEIFKKLRESGPDDETVIGLYLGGGNNDKERITAIKEGENSSGVDLERVRKAYENISLFVKLDKIQEDSLKAIKEEIKSPSDNTPSDLTTDTLNKIFGTTGISATEIKESLWKNTKNFNTEKNLKELIGNYYKGSGKPEEGELKHHLEHENWGGKWGGNKITGDKYWEDFVKKGPEFIIGAIKHLEWEAGKGDYSDATKKNGVLTEMESYNDEEKAKKENKEITETWDKNKASHIAQFLYKKATGGELYKATKALKTPEKDENGGDKDKSFLAHLKRNWIPYTLGLLSIVVIAGLAIWFWEDIKGLFGTSEGDADKENE